MSVMFGMTVAPMPACTTPSLRGISRIVQFRRNIAADYRFYARISGLSSATQDSGGKVRDAHLMCLFLCPTHYRIRPFGDILRRTRQRMNGQDERVISPPLDLRRPFAPFGVGF